ncbi:hypothetical protein [Burkholderia ubonensis]|uniref:hypothetical protein n=1 Tax=Burkholderia ubonensis TaxID=101571 RepID=UPI000A61EEB8|nr:hypothetical protein [Burkholderia ubonensis]
MPKSYRYVSAFIDWNSQLLLCGVNIKENPQVAARLTFEKTARKITTCLCKLAPGQQFQIGLRLYHGWHKGFEPSPNLKAIRQIISETDFAALSTKPNVVFLPDVGFGDCLISALPMRIHEKLAIHLPNTLRRERNGTGFEEKMVDTALASDIIVTAYQEPENWILVLAEDDDLVPPLFVAEAVVKREGSRVLLLSNRARNKNFLKLDDICLGG